MTTTANTEMRLRYLATEKGGMLRVDSPGLYSIVRAVDGAVIFGPSGSLASVAAYLIKIDPTIGSAV